jgi:uncharacterized protein
MTPPTGTGPPRAPVPPGWPGDDPTVPDDLDLLGGRRRGLHRRRVRARRAPHDGADDANVEVEPARTRPVEAPRGLDDAAHRDDGVVDEPADDTPVDLEHDDAAVAGRQPAGRVLVIIVAALVLAMLVNADALVARAERRPPGRARDRALAVWHPVQDVSHALQLHRIRELADRVVGDDGDDEGSAPSSRDARRRPADDGARESTTTTAPDAGGAEGSPAPVELRTPTADDPLRLWVGGDSMAEMFGPALATLAGGTGLVEPTVHYEMASGLTRPDYYDWPDALGVDVAADDPEVLVVVFGVNDGQGIVLPDGTPVPDMDDPRWSTEYRRRVADLMDSLRADDRLLLWVLLPPMRDADYAARMAVVTRAVQAEAGSRPWVVPVDAGASLADASGAFAESVPDAAGTSVRVRRDDGIHLTEPGAGRLAAQVMETLVAHVDLSGAAG